MISRHPRKCDGAGFEIRFVTSTFSSRKQNLSRSDFQSLPSHCSWSYWSNFFVLLTCLYTHVLTSVVCTVSWRLPYLSLVCQWNMSLFVCLGVSFFKVGCIHRRLCSLSTDTNANNFVCYFTWIFLRQILKKHYIYTTQKRVSSITWSYRFSIIINTCWIDGSFSMFILISGLVLNFDQRPSSWSYCRFPCFCCPDIYIYICLIYVSVSSVSFVCYHGRRVPWYRSKLFLVNFPLTSHFFQFFVVTL